ncbi:MAG TPA: nucleotidyltransferase family protein [Steroidobacteraceae bacterium]|nr:nucleotidyltransferase family protein [Steroidobacteraceae bacterium]
MNAVTLPRLQIVILAAGFSSRLGRPKALARVHGLSLLRRTLDLARRFAPAKIVIVVPRRAARLAVEARGPGVVLTVNSSRADGLSSSVRRGITQARHSAAVLLLPVDLATLQQRDVARLISRWRAAPRRVIARRVERHAGTPNAGIPLILPRWLYARARAVQGDIGLRQLVSGLPADQRVLLTLPSAAQDVDTPHDLRAARRRLRATSTSL